MGLFDDTGLEQRRERGAAMVACSDTRSLTAAIQSELRQKLVYGEEENTLGDMVALAILERIGNRFRTLQDVLRALELVQPSEAKAAAPADLTK